MVLKSLLLQGFKSFPDKTEIRFLGGMTAIVGPNGSGKSNIADALRWVLGEQSSRSLRGAKMEDVIFSGAQKRSPVGFAEVSLILDNSEGVFASEHTEIMITRRYYRSGESEYAINKRRCRLKDIHELFMDTGLGRDGYSIIGQGRIDEILSLKSEDRREVFEEAAGITKFRARKEEAERKLDAAGENLARIDDLYSELENQAGPLEKQADKAQRFLLLRDELRELEVSLWLEELARLRDDPAPAHLQTCAGQLEQTRQALAGLYTRAEELGTQMRQKDVEADNLRRALHECEQQAAGRQSRCAVLAADIQHYEENRARAEREQAQQAGQAQALAGQQDARQQKCAALEAAYARCQQQLQDMEQAVGAQTQKRDEAHKRQTQIEEQIAVQQGSNFQLALDRTAAQAGLDGMDARQDTLARDLAAAGDQLAAEERVQQGYAGKLEQVRAQLPALQGRLDALRAQQAGLDRQAQAQADALRQAQAAYTDNQNRIAMLRDMQKEYEGFSQAVRRTMKRAESGAQKGIHGPVSALLTTDARFVTAIETALGAAASHIVVDTAADAKAAIDFLKRSGSGRATFLPLDTIRPARLKEDGLDKQPGCFGTADALTECEARYRPIVQNLLARTAVAQDLDAALALARAYHHRFRIVTLDGQVVQAGGAMTGGSVSKTTGALARADALRRLEQEQSGLQARQAVAEQALQAAKQDAARLAERYQQIEDEKNRCAAEQDRLTALMTQHGALLQTVRTRYEGLGREQDNMDAARQAYQDTIAQKTEQLAAAQQALDRLEADRRAAQAEEQAANESLTEYAAQQIALRTAAAENRTEAAAEGRALEDLQRLRQEVEQGLQDAERRFAALTEQIAQSRTALRREEQDAQQDAARAESLRAQIAGAAQQRLQLEAEKTKTDRQAQEQNEQIHRLARENDRLEARCNQIRERENQILTQMWDSYELTPNSATQQAAQAGDVPAAQKRAQALRDQIRSLGHINLDAVEEYRALSERIAFLGGQKADLEAAQRDLRQVIGQLTVQMKEIFSSEFAKLNAYFGQTFREIFGGGHARLELADTSDVLHCGIDILVSPPGKSIKTLTLLSGGERAFVAIALYFAILKLRPAPFSVLDEIEAALDDVNVVRFAQYVRRLSDQTQFIVITHRRGTMEASDMLYGVTMQERGVSRLLMLNLDEAVQQSS